MTAADRTNLPDSADPLDRLRRRAYRHAVEDGAIDLVAGVFALTVGVATQRRPFLAIAVVCSSGCSRSALASTRATG
jgi:hypothetical protein